MGLDNLILNVALPTIQRDFGASQTDLQWTVDAYALVFGALLLFSGDLGRPLRSQAPAVDRSHHLRQLFHRGRVRPEPSERSWPPAP
jgi:MFS family permease